MRCKSGESGSGEGAATPSPPARVSGESRKIGTLVQLEISKVTTEMANTVKALFWLSLILAVREL